MPRFLTVEHHVVSIGCWQRYCPDPMDTVGCEQAEVLDTTLSSTPSVTTNTTSCGVSPALLVPAPGAGMMVLSDCMADEKLVSVSWLQLVDVRQLLSCLLYTSDAADEEDS